MPQAARVRPAPAREGVARVSPTMANTIPIGASNQETVPSNGTMATTAAISAMTKPVVAAVFVGCCTGACGLHGGTWPAVGGCCGVDGPPPCCCGM